MKPPAHLLVPAASDPDAGRKSAIVRKLTSDLKKRTQRTQIDGKKADALHKKCDCAGMPNRYN
jgi:hypothetical protein